ncbi:uncharacterized protein DDB_G0284459 [Drosophila bipectinata]|uniref:uncharacterized protein DDB_G0284459 n=1 Tax=Drosophila bipectinata TaxID=42026 RepID=UPI001C88E66A|nr:uncharacterized protein LOC108132750 [Drosophila bipectinata]
MSCLCQPRVFGGGGGDGGCCSGGGGGVEGNCSPLSRKRNSGSTMDEFDKASTVAQADDTDYISPRTPADLDPDPETPADAEENDEFTHLCAFRRKVYDAIAALNDESFDKHMARLLMHYESAIREEFELAQLSPERCRKLARILISLTDVVHTMAQGRTQRQEDGYRQRMCHIMGFYISCELCAAQEPIESEQCIVNRISSCLKLYVEYGTGGAGVHREHVLRTLLAAPKLFNRASILSVLYSRLFPHWKMPSIMLQLELPDKLYIEYILIFYYWQRLEPDKAVKERIVDFADKFMRPSKSLAMNSMYANYLPKYTAQNAATRTILEYLRLSSGASLHVASKADNRLPQSDEVILSSDDEDSCPLWDSMEAAPTTTTNNHPPIFLQNLCRNARQLEPCKRATALFSGIDNSIEIVELRDSDDEVEMFSVNFNVPANVDGNTSNSNSNDANQITTIHVEDDSMAVTRIYPSNLRTYKRAVTLAPSPTYTVPRIVSSYSCRRDSLHLVSTTAPHLVDQGVQSSTNQDEYDNDGSEVDQSHVQKRGFHYLRSRRTTLSSGSGSNTPLHHSRQSSSQNSHCSETSLTKKQVTFSPQHLGATASSSYSGALKKPAIKRYKSTTPADRLEALRQTTRKDHFQASAQMFAKLEAKKIKHTREYTPSQLTPTTTNSSSGTPPRNGAPPQKQKVVLPTPPASTHSSSSPCQVQRASTDTLSSIDQEKLWSHNKYYDLPRRFPKTSISDQVKFYNQLLSIQREKIRRHRLKAKALREMQAKVDYRKLKKQAEKQCRQLRKLNAKRRKELRRLEHDLAIIRNCAIKRYPIVRLKRCNLKRLELPANSNQKTQKQQEEQPQETPKEKNQEKHGKLSNEEKPLLEKKKRPEKAKKKKKKLKKSKEEEVQKRETSKGKRSKPEKEKQLKEKPTSLDKAVEKEKRVRLRTADKLEKKKRPKQEKAKKKNKQSMEKPKHVEEHIHTDEVERQVPEESQEDHRLKEPESTQLETPQQPPQNRKRRKRRRAHSIWSHIKSRKKKHPEIEAPIEELQVDSRLETEPVAEEPEPAAEEVPSPIFEEQDQNMVPEVGNELEVRPDNLEPEEDETSRLLTPANDNDLDQVTSHVPVYLLNGESRDVSTPLPSSQSSASEGLN